MSGGKIIPLIVARDEALRAELRAEACANLNALRTDLIKALDLVHGRIEILRMEVEELKQGRGTPPS